MNRKKIFWSLLMMLGGLWLLAPQQVSATHIVGGELSYRSLGNNLYEIRLVLRRDCLNGAPDAQFDNPASIGFFDAQTNELVSFVGFNGQLLIPFNGDDTLNTTLISDCTIAGSDICVHQTVYRDTIFLPYRPTGYVMAYQRCCRNGTLTNVLNPLSTGMTLAALLSGRAQLEQNSSPRFVDFPAVYVCANEPFVFDHSAVDIDGDSLSYCLEEPFSGGSIIFNMPQPPNPPPFERIVWRPPYSLDNVMGGVPLTIDPVTGVLTATPNTVGQFIVSICVRAYKDGEEIGRIRRDFQFNVRACNDEPSAAFDVPALTCDGLTVEFVNTSINTERFEWTFDLGNPGSPTSTEVSPTYTFPAEGFYQIQLLGFDTNRLCFDTAVTTIGVFIADIEADFSYDVPACTDSVTVQATDLSTGTAHPPASWAWLLTHPGGILTSAQQHPSFTFEVDGEALVYLTLVVADSNGCTATKVDSFLVRQLDLQLNPEAFNLCAGDSTHLLLNGDSTLTYTWSPPTGLDLTHLWDPIGSPDSSTTYYVTVTDGLCELSDSIRVEVQQLPDLGFSFETDCKSLVVSFANTSTGGINFHWDFGVDSLATDTSIVVSPGYTYPGPGIYVVTLSSRDGCDASVTDTVTVAVITETFDNQLINCFEESIALNPDNISTYVYQWSPGEFLDDPNSPNPLATIDTNTWFYVTVTDPALPDCPIFDSIHVIIPFDFTLDVGQREIVSCDFTPIVLVATSDADVTFSWKDGNGQVLSDNDTLVIIPMVDEAIYIVMATDTFGCMKTDSVRILRPDPTFSVQALPDSTYCDIQTITLGATSSAMGVTFQWYNEDLLLVGEGPEIDVTPGQPSCYYLVGTDPIGCQAADTVCLTPVFFNLSITGDQSTCLGDPVTITVTDANGQNLSYEWFPQTGIISGNGTNSIVVQPTENITYSVLVTNTDLGCEQTLTSSVMVYLFDPVVITIDADPDTIVISESSQLIVNQVEPGLYTYQWISSTGEVVEGVFNPVVMPGETTTYTVLVTDQFGCQGSASVTVVVENPFCDERDIFLPNAFTPNGDGENDYLFVRGNYITSIDFHIFNRWGQEVFTTTDQSTPWDGTFNGKKLQPDVFGYYLTVFCPNGESYFKKGNITLLE